MAGQDVSRNIALVEDLCQTMKFGSLCALGGFTPYPVMSALTHFPEDFARSPRLEAVWNLFDDLEKVMPHNVRLIQIRPQVNAENEVLLADANARGFLPYGQRYVIGEPLAKVQHPEAETFMGSPMYNAGATCTDCHSTRVLRADGTLYTSHWFTSPIKIMDGFVGKTETGADVVALDGPAAVALLKSLPAAGIAGGRTYDALIARCAQQAVAGALLTLNPRHFDPAPPGVAIVEPLVPGDPLDALMHPWVVEVPEADREWLAGRLRPVRARDQDTRAQALEAIDTLGDRRIARGLLGLEGEGYRIEFRNLKVKPLK